MENIQITSKYEYKNKNKGYERTYDKLSKKIPQTARNIIGKFFEKIFAPVGLTMRREPNHLSTFDTRILIAGMTLLQVHDITGVNRQ